MAFERPIVFVRTLPAGVDTASQYFLADIYSVLNSSVITAVGVVTGGAGYLIGDTLEPNDGTGTQAGFTVTSVSGGSITGVEITDGKGGLYSVVPTTSPNSVSTLTGVGAGAALNLTVTKNWTVAGGTQTTDTGLTAAIVQDEGSGYSIGNLLTASGGTSVYPATLRVLSVGGNGQITSWEIEHRGSYSVNPSPLADNPVTGGAGNATFDLTMGTNSQGVGSLSFKAVTLTTPSILSEPFEILFQNEGANPTTPDVLNARVGINPDGSSHAISDTTAGPGLTSPNYSGTTVGPLAFRINPGSGPGNTSRQYMLFDFGDTLIMIMPNAAQTSTDRGFIVGLAHQPRYQSDADGSGGANSLRLDGLAVFGYVIDADFSSGTDDWFSSSTVGQERAVRLSTGNSRGTTVQVAWTQHGDAVGDVSSDIPYALKNGAPRIAPQHLLASNGVYLGELKHFKAGAPRVAFTLVQVNGHDTFMHLDNSTSARTFMIHIPDGLDPFTDGVYVP